MTAVPLHKGSASAVNDALQLFDLPPTDTSMTAARMLEFTPISQGINPMEFVVPGVDAFIDLSRSYFNMKLRLRKQNGTDLADGELLYPANKFGPHPHQATDLSLERDPHQPSERQLCLQSVSGNHPQLQRQRRPHPHHPHPRP